MSASVYEFTSYKEYLEAWLASQPKAGHGLRRKMAEVIGTQTGFVTQVLSGAAHFSAEQTFSLSSMLGLSSEETQFLQLLLQNERAGTSEYRKHIEKQIAKVLEERKTLSRRLKSQDFPSDVDQHRYFSSWLYACVHVMTTCEQYQTSRESIAKALGMPLELISEILEFLLKTGLVQEKSGKLSPGQTRLHLGTDSPYLVDHHRNWNWLALQELVVDVKKDMHYSSVVSLAKKDIEAIKEIFMKAIDQSKKVVKDSEGEKIFATTLNFFEIC